MSSEMAGKINSNYNKSNPEKEYIRQEDKNTDWLKRVAFAAGKNPLEFARAKDMAIRLLNKNYTAEDLKNLGEDSLAQLCERGEDDLDMAVVVAASFALERFQGKKTVN